MSTINFLKSKDDAVIRHSQNPSLSNEDFIWAKLHEFIEDNVSSLRLGRTSVIYENSNYVIEISLSNYPYYVGLGVMMENSLGYILEKTHIRDITITEISTLKVVHRFDANITNSSYRDCVFALLSEHLTEIQNNKLKIKAENNKSVAEWMKKEL